MSEIPPPKKPKFARGQSDGKYLGAHGPTNKFQAQWFEHTALEGQPQRKDWLSDGGVDDKNSYQAHCSICPAFFQCRKQAILAHEDSKAHKQKAAAWLVKQLIPSTPSLLACSRRCSRGAQSLTCVMVPGSVEDERMFSTLKYIRNPQRNRLQAQHLTCCAQGFKISAFGVESIPNPQAILEWLSAA